MAKKTPDIFERSEIKETEWWVTGKLCEWINKIFKDKGVNYHADIEKEIISDKIKRTRPDILIFQNPKISICVIEVKPPSWDPLTRDLVEDAFFKADRGKAPYFATWNINKFVLFNTYEYDKTRSLREGIVQAYDVANIHALEEIEKAEYKIKIKSFLESFINDLILINENKKVIPKIPIDEYFILYLRSTVEALANSYKETIYKNARKNLAFKKKIVWWYNEQMWSFTGEDKNEYTRIARQAAYLMINKILFYTALQAKFDLDPLEIPKGLRKGETLEQLLRIYFGAILKIDYETVFTTEFIDEVAFPEAPEAVESIKDLINEIERYKISSIGYDVLGRIFENLLPEEERHKLGQYFTNSYVVDLILKFCLNSEKDFVLDPSCGAGTFLVRAYTHKKLENPRLQHDDILSTLWGIDISKFASHLSTINLAIKDLSVLENYPRIIYSDFFDIYPGSLYFEKPKREKEEKIDVYGYRGKLEREKEFAPEFDCIVGNPPYTRQEEIEDLQISGYKNQLIAKANTYGLTNKIAKIKHELREKQKELEIEFENEVQRVLRTHYGTTVAIEIKEREIERLKLVYLEKENGLIEKYNEKINELVESSLKYEEKIANISKRAGIHAYFFIHGYKFLKEGGRFGFIVSNSWMDVDYGKGLQEFFLKHYKIIAIIESKVERWFEDADINTCIVILEKCKDEKQRNENLVKFVQLKKELEYFIPIAENDKKSEAKRIREIEKLVDQIKYHAKYYENDEIRIYPKKQEDLWNEGFDKETKQYVGAKWGKYIRAPEIFFKILEKAKDKLVPLKEVADVRFGIKTGANEFFYLTQEDIKFWNIEKEFWMHPIEKNIDLKIYPEKDMFKDRNGEYFKNSQYSKIYQLCDVLRNNVVYWAPNYVIKSPRECNSIIIKPENLKYRVLMIHKDKKDLEGTNILKYIEYGESKGFHERPTCASRERWYDLGERNFSSGFWMMTIRDRCLTYLNSSNVYTDARLYDIYIESDISKLIITYLNSSLSILFTELLSRSYGGGGGPIDVKVYEIKNMPIPVFSKMLKCDIKKLEASFDKISSREIGSVFSEIGANTPKEVSLDKVKSDRRELDKIIFEILGLNEDEQLEVYKGVVELVRSRIEKAKSVGKNYKKKISIENIIANKILDEIEKDERFKKFLDRIINYAEILSMPKFKKEPKIEKTIEGWQLTDGKKRIFFDDINKAKYCRTFASIGITTIKIPKGLSEEDIISAENFVEIINSFINSAAETITDRKIKNKIKIMVIGKISSKLNSEIS